MQHKTSLSKIALGTMQFLWTASEEDAFKILDTYFDLGGNIIDTADMYPNWVDGFIGGEVETIIGKWMKKKKNRDKIFLTTKVRARMWPGKDGEGLSRKHIIKAIEKSLIRLKTDYIDLYIAHWPDPETPIEETLAAFEELVKQGKVKEIGCSNYPVEELIKALEHGRRSGFSFNLIELNYNLIDRKVFESDFLPIVERYNLKVMAYGPLASGFLTGAYRKDRPLPQHDRAKFVKDKMTDDNFKVLEQLDKLAQKYNKTVCQIALVWLLNKNFINGAIVGADNSKQIKECFGALNFMLNPEDLKNSIRCCDLIS